jgi:hypothetical protein
MALNWEEDDRKITIAPISSSKNDSQEFLSLKDIFKNNKKEKKEDFSFWKDKKPYSKKKCFGKYKNDLEDDDDFLSFWDKNIPIYKDNNEHIVDINDGENDQEEMKVSLSSIKQ